MYLNPQISKPSRMTIFSHFFYCGVPLNIR